MARTKRKLSNSAGQPTVSVKAERTVQSLAGERALLLRRRVLMIAIPGLVVLLLAGGLLYSYASGPARTAAPVGSVPTAAPTVRSDPTAAPAPSTTPPGAALGSGGLICPEIAGLPIFANAICIEHDADKDDGITKNKNTYASSASADEVRRFYEGAFAQNGWTVAEAKQDLEDNDWSYSLTQAQRRLKIEIKPAEDASGAVTKITIGEK